jgi:alpha-beta hydrolase superfamily lysophospholipase
MHRISERLPQIACPTFVLWGADDRVIPVRDARRFGELIPDARVLVLPDTGHVAMLERPARFNTLLDEFLAERPLDPSSGAARGPGSAGHATGTATPPAADALSA